MMTGSVNSYHEATVRLPIRAANGQEQDIVVILDTGFSGSLTLPPALISALGLPFRSRGNAVLADGSTAQFDIHTAIIIWDGLMRHVLVEVADTDPLIGMNLLYGHSIFIEAIDGGRVTVESLSS